MPEERLIYADDFLDLFYVASAGQDKAFISAVEMVMKDTPTIDAVEVIRCKDCKRYRGTNYGFMVCGKFDVISCEDDFCVWGERKTDAEVHDDA